MGVLSALFEVVLSVFTFIVDTLMEMFSGAVPSRRKTKYDADFGVADTSVVRSTGFYVANWRNSLKESNSHLIVIGGSGSQKSVNVAFNTLLQPNSRSSYIIHDCNKELESTAAYFKKLGYKVLFLDYESENSECFNFLEWCKKAESLEKTLGVLMSNSSEGPKDYWYQSAENLTTFFGKAIWKYAGPEYRNMANVVHILNVFSYNPAAVDRWVVSNCNAQTISEYKGIAATPEKTLQCSLSTAKTALAIFNNTSIQRLTGSNTIDFESFRKEPTVLFISNSPGTAHYYRSVSATFFQSFFDYVLEKLPSPGDLNLTLIIDEAATIKLTSLSSFLALSRKFSVSCATIWQDLGQIEHLYGRHEAANIFANSNVKAFMPGPKPMETCAMLERLLGKYSIEEEGQLKTRELLTAQEIYQLRKILLLNGNSKPVLLESHPYYENKKLLQRSQLPEYVPAGNIHASTPPLLQF
ncbi:MAG TPA: type IV secretory system conjugative DNA transfer family protein [Flavipsychrobacter sp.]|nr:type IV secretory system conjugative DNA transfer family protein [Flavipsychrobacter sp.]